MSVRMHTNHNYVVVAWLTGPVTRCGLFCRAISWPGLINFQHWAFLGGDVPGCVPCEHVDYCAAAAVLD